MNNVTVNRDLRIFEVSYADPQTGLVGTITTAFDGPYAVERVVNSKGRQVHYDETFSINQTNLAQYAKDITKKVARNVS